MWGSSCLKMWGTSQDVIALSSGEAEYYGLVKTTTNAIGPKSLLADVRVEVRAEVCTDSSVAFSHLVWARCRKSPPSRGPATVVAGPSGKRTA